MKGFHCCHGDKVAISNKCRHLLLLLQGTCVPNLKLVCFQTASLGWHARVAMETRCSWQQANYELQSAPGTYVPNMKSDQKSFKQQILRCMPLLPWLQHFHVNKSYYPLEESN